MSGTSAATDLDSLLQFLAPETAQRDAGSRAVALQVAQPYRPWCLPTVKQDQAQVYYAAWLLSLQRDGFGDGSGGDPNNSNVQRKKEGDIDITFFSLTMMGLSADLLGHYGARYMALARICRTCSGPLSGGTLTPPCAPFNVW